MTGATVSRESLRAKLKGFIMDFNRDFILFICDGSCSNIGCLGIGRILRKQMMLLRSSATSAVTSRALSSASLTDLIKDALIVNLHALCSAKMAIFSVHGTFQCVIFLASVSEFWRIIVAKNNERLSGSISTVTASVCNP